MRAWVLGTVILVVAALGCAGGRLAAQSQQLTDVRGVIEEVNARNSWYGIVPDGDRGTRYAPDRLPDEFKKNGLRVVFSGRSGPVDPTVRSWGIPLVLTSLRAEAVR